MKDEILTFNEQFAYQPEIVGGQLPQAKHIIHCGMGGSGHPGDLLKLLDPTLAIKVHRDYGLPYIADDQKQDTLIIADSFSGNTEEALDALQTAIDQGFAVIVIGTGGTIIELAQQNNIPYIQLPSTGIEPRMGIGYQIRALTYALGQQTLFAQLGSLAETLDPASFEQEGQKLAQQIKGRIPLIYSSMRNRFLGYYFKITLNETGKTMAFNNVIPEMNHNEIEGFHTQGSTSELLDKTYSIFIRDESDHPRIIKRMDVFADMIQDIEGAHGAINIRPDDHARGVFEVMVRAMWTSYHLATMHDIDPKEVSVIENFKQQI